MAHELSIRANGTAEIAYVGATPWHGLGQKLEQGASIDEWRVAAGMDWTIDRAPCLYRVETPNGKAYVKVQDRDVLHRSDTKAALGVVSDGYHAVQPGEVLEFFRDLVEAYDYQLDVAGCLFGGKRFWALARTGEGDYVVDRDDQINRFLLLATACDGSMVTRGQNTGVRVVCNNTLGAAIHGSTANLVKVSHRMRFDADKMKDSLGIQRRTFAEFMDEMRALAAVKVSPIVAARAASDLFPTTKKDSETGKLVDPVTTFPVQSVLGLFNGKARGSQYKGVMGTAYGFVQAVAEFVDHEARAHTNDNRLNSAWFGRGSELKADAVTKILELAA